MDRIDELRAEIRNARDNYWNAGISPLTDTEYDILVEELRRLTGGYDPVMGPAVVSSGKVQHPKRAPMLSMNKVYDIMEVAKWVEKLRAEYGSFVKTLIAMPKYDGIALRRYSNGVIATRGDGMTGENVTEVASPFVRGAGDDPSTWIDGEAVCTYTNFLKLAALGYKNPRNAVSGIMSSKDKAIRARAELLTFVPYNRRRYAINLQAAKDLPATLERYVEVVRKNCADFPMDGIVFRLANLKLFQALGHTDHHWRGQIALKFKGETAETIIERIDWQVKNGTVTPVATLAPVNLDGAELSRVTLHNADYVTANGIVVGDSVVVERAGGVIPSVVRVTHKTESTEPVIPTKCPVCNSKLLRSGARLYCAVCEYREKKK